MKLQLFVLEKCPYCIQTKQDLKELLLEEKYKEVEIEEIDERKNESLANQYDYHYVPCFFQDGVKLHEGAITKEELKSMLEKVIQKDDF